MVRAKPRAWLFSSFARRQGAKNWVDEASSGQPRDRLGIASSVVDTGACCFLQRLGLWFVELEYGAIRPGGLCSCVLLRIRLWRWGRRTYERSRRVKRAEWIELQLDCYCSSRAEYHPHLHGR